MLVPHDSHKITEGQVTFQLLPPCPSTPSCLLPPGYGRKSYISPPAKTPPLITEGQDTFLLLLQHPLIREGQVTVKPYGLSVGQIWPTNPSLSTFWVTSHFKNSHLEALSRGWWGQ